jgi:hypothetical protein
VKPLTWIGLLLLAGLALYVYGCEQRRVGGLKAEIATLKQQAKAIDTVYVTRTRTLVKVRRVTDSILRTDTLFRDTTVRRLVVNERLVCDAVIETCEDKVANLNAQIDKLIKQRPGFFKRTGGKLVWFGAGMLAGKLLLH